MVNISLFSHYFNKISFCQYIFLGILMVTAIHVRAAHAGQVTLSWNAPQNSRVSGYKIHYGTRSREYSESIDTGTLTNHTISDLKEDTTYYFAATAYVSSSAEISNVFDTERSSRVIQLNGTGIDHGYQLLTGDMSGWGNPDQLIAEWSMKYREPFEVFFDVETTKGHRYLAYPPVDGSTLGSGEFVRHGIGSFVADGMWHTVVRDLQKDLEAAQPDARITQVNSFLIRGSGRLDDIKLHQHYPDAADLWGVDAAIYEDGEDGLTDGWHLYLDLAGKKIQAESGFSNEVAAYIPGADSDNDGLPDSRELTEYGTNPGNPDTDGDGSIDGIEIYLATNPLDWTSFPTTNTVSTIYENGDNGSPLKWRVYLNLTSDAAEPEVIHVYDSRRSSDVIQFNGSGIDHGYRLVSDGLANWQNKDQFILQWSMSYIEEFEIFVDIETSAGHRYLTYSPIDNNILGAGEFVRYGIGRHSTDGAWRTFVRDLQADIEQAQPGVTVMEVNGFLIRGSGRVDDIKLHSEFR